MILLQFCCCFCTCSLLLFLSLFWQCYRHNHEERNGIITRSG